MDVTILYALFGIVIAGVPALHCLRKATQDERWVASYMFRFEIVWLVYALAVVGGLAGFTVGKIITSE